MKIAIVNSQIVFPDKNKVIENGSLLIENGLITRIDKVKYRYDYSVDMLIDAEEGYLIPGLINHHSHGFTLGPLFPNGAKPISFEFIFRNLNRHLIQGTTTLLNLDGFATFEEVEIIKKLHPMNIKMATSYTPLNVKAAMLVDGFGIKQIHKKISLEEIIQRGAVALGEIGGGGILGGGSASYLYLPKAIEEKIGKRITTEQSNNLKIAVLGKSIDPSFTDREKIKIALKEAELEEQISIEEAISIVMDSVYSSVEVARNGIREAAKMSVKYNIPMIAHNAAASKEVIFEVAKKLGPKLIAGHSNHMSYTEQEMIDTAKELKKYGVIIDILSGDSFKAKQLMTSGQFDATLQMIEEGLVDLISTDFMGGNWDSILQVLEAAVIQKKISLPQAIALATSNVVKAIPGISPNGGIIEEGKVADVVILNNKQISKVKHVFINGIPVILDGIIKIPKPHWIW